MENFSPGTMGKLGLDYDKIARQKPDIVYGSIRRFSSNSPYRGRPAWDPVVQAMSGIMSIMEEAEGSPVRAGPSICDITSGIYAALVIVSAHYEKTPGGGGGKRIEVPMLASALSLVSERIVLYSLNPRTATCSAAAPTTATGRPSARRLTEPTCRRIRGSRPTISGLKTAWGSGI